MVGHAPVTKHLLLSHLKKLTSLNFNCPVEKCDKSQKFMLNSSYIRSQNSQHKMMSSHMTCMNKHFTLNFSVSTKLFENIYEVSIQNNIITVTEKTSLLSNPLLHILIAGIDMATYMYN